MFPLGKARRAVPYVPQMEMAECGAACLAMVLGYHGHHAPLAEVREACGVSRDGASAYAIAHAAKRLGLAVQALSLDVDHLTTIALPAILHWEFNHFVVLERVTARGAVIIDPDLGRRRVTREQLQLSFTGVALSFAPTAALRPRSPRRPSLARYRDVLRQSAPGLLMVLGASLCLDAIALVFPAATQMLVDLVIVPEQSRWLWGIAAVLFGATLVRTLLLFLRGYLIQNLQYVVDLGLMGRFLEHLMHLPLTFFQTRMEGDLVRRVQDNSAVRDLFTSRSVAALLDVMLLLGYAALMLAYHPGLGSVVIALALTRVAVSWATRDRIENASRTELSSMGKEAGALVEALSVPEVTKAFGSEARMVARYANRLVHRLNAGLVRRRMTAAVSAAMVLLDGAGKAAIVWVGGREVLDDRMTIGVLSAFLLLELLFTEPLKSIITVLSDLQYIDQQLRRLDDVMDTEREPSGSRDPGRLRGALSLQDVAYRYGAGGQNVLTDINLAVAPGEKIALVGRSGAGKSTLARLLLGMIRPSEGTVRIDGHDLRELDLSKVRAQFGVVLQESFFFDDSIRANLSLGDTDLPLARLQSAAQLACVDDVIEALPEGYDTILGRSGTDLSGGQRQRLALARALARRPAVLLLDEATSSLDLEHERRVHGNLARVACTRVIIAHRLQTVVDADRILVLDAGRIVDQGTYAQLCARPGLFRDLVGALAN